MMIEDTGAEEAFYLRLKRETAKYDVVRSLIADLAARESRKSNNLNTLSVRALQAFARDDPPEDYAQYVVKQP